MDQVQTSLSLLVIIVGTLIVLNILIKSASERVGFPALAGYIVLGFVLRLSDTFLHVLPGSGTDVFEFLAELGVVTLLFKVGLESDFTGLLRQLRTASLIWAGNVMVSFAAGYWASLVLLGLDIIPSLFVGIALTATSLGVSVGAWNECGAVSTEEGELLVDVAEMDDISSVLLMVLLFALVPVLHHEQEGSMLLILGREIFGIIVKMVLFVGICLLFSRFAERRVSEFFGKRPAPPKPVLIIAGIGFIMAALADMLGFSLAIGAFFAGLIFSRDPEAVKIEASFESLFELFSPFFFIGIGLQVEPGSLSAGAGVAGVLLAAAVTGKIVGNALPALRSTGLTGALLLGVSMIPRAEIAMIVMQRGQGHGAWAVPAHVFSGMVLVSIVTCVVPPFFIRSMLARWIGPRKKQSCPG